MIAVIKRPLFWTVLRGPIQTSPRSVIGTRAPQKTFILGAVLFSTPVAFGQTFFAAFFQKSSASLPASKPPVVIAAGGTSGHLFPAEALAAALLGRGERVLLMTDARSGAAKSAVFAQCEIHVVPGAGVAGRSILRAIQGLWAILCGVLAARQVLVSAAPSVVVGFGGYPAVAPMLAARSLARRPKLILHDQNAVLGKANMLLARFADVVAVSFAKTGRVPARRATVVTGNPVRPAIAARQKAPYVLPGEAIQLLVLGGSLGATAFAALIPAALGRLPAVLRARILLTMQCPAPVLDVARGALEAAGVKAVLAPFFDDVAGLLAQAHLVVARSGGSTVAELAVIGRPAILIPLRINDDQRANAEALVQAGGALLVEQSEGDEALALALETLLKDTARLEAMAQAAGRMGIVDAAGRLATLTQDVMERVA